MIEHETSVNPYHPAASESKPVTSNTLSLKYISYGIYLQLFLGAGLLSISATGVNTRGLLDGPYACGGLLIGLGLNSLIYVNRYKKSLGD